MQTSFAIVMLLGAAQARHHVPASRNYFAVGATNEEILDAAEPVHHESSQLMEAYLNDTDIPNQANIQVKYNDAGLWQYELLQLNEEPSKEVAAALAEDAKKKEAVYDPKWAEYGATEKVQSLNPIAYQYLYDTNKTGDFRRARSTWY